MTSEGWLYPEGFGMLFFFSSSVWLLFLLSTTQQYIKEIQLEDGKIVGYGKDILDYIIADLGVEKVKKQISEVN